MSQWQHKVELKDLHDNYQQGLLTIQEVASGVACRLEILKTQIQKKNNKFEVEYLPQLEEIILEFQEFAKDEVSDVNDYDSILNELYDFGDTRLDSVFGGKTLCWINSMF